MSNDDEEFFAELKSAEKQSLFLLLIFIAIALMLFWYVEDQRDIQTNNKGVTASETIASTGECGMVACSVSDIMPWRIGNLPC